MTAHYPNIALCSGSVALENQDRLGYAAVHRFRTDYRGQSWSITVYGELTDAVRAAAEHELKTAVKGVMAQEEQTAAAAVIELRRAVILNRAELAEFDTAA